MRKIEKLTDQPSIEIALDKLRKGICLLLEDGVFNYIFELRKIENLNGAQEEQVFGFDSKDNTFKDIYDIKWWCELHAEYVNCGHCTMSSADAFEELKAGKPIMSPRHVYFTGTINSNGLPEINDIKYVFAINDYRSNNKHVYILDTLDDFHLPDDSDYGYVF